MKFIKLAGGKVAKVDDDDFEELSKFKWCVSGGGYASRSKRVHGEARAVWFRMHRVIMGAKEGEMVDHINGDTLDNRRENLRIATASENSRNRRKKKTNKAGYKGVFLRTDSPRTKYIAQICHLGAKRHIGSFSTPEAAYEAYVREAKIAHGDFFHP